MSSQSEKPWTEEEKYFLLTEILKKAGIPSAYLFSIVRENRIVPNWLEIPLPSGRSVNSCQAAFQRMEHDYGAPQHRQSLSGPIAPFQISPVTKKRPLAPLQPDRISAPRAIQPKPISAPGRYSTNTEPHTPVQVTPTASSPTGEPRRKRGRPSKVEIQRRSMMAQAKGEPYPSSTRPSPKPLLTMPPVTKSTTLEPSPLPRNAHGPDTRTIDIPSGGLGAMRAPRMDSSGSQDVQMQGMPRLHASVGSGNVPVTKPSSELGESTSRALIDKPTQPTAHSLAASFRGINQSGPIPPGPKPEAMAVSNVTTVESGRETSQSIPGAAGGSKP